MSVQNMADSGNALTISTFSAGDILGANLVFSSRNYYPMTVVALSRTTILHLQRELMLRLCQSNTGFMIALMRAISDRTLILTDKISSISLKTIRQRITDFLESQSRIQQSRVVMCSLAE